MPSCIPGDVDTSYLASPDFMVLSCHVITSITIPVSTFGAYCILFKTPLRMKQFKLLLLNLHIWCSLSDIDCSLLGVPYMYYPVIAGYGLGIIDSPVIIAYCGVTFFIALNAAILSIYENRYFVLFGRNTWWRNVRKPYLIVTWAMVPFIFLPPFLNLPDPETAGSIALSRIPCVPPFTFSDRKLIVLALDVSLPLYCVAFGCVYLSGSIFTFQGITFHKLILRRQQSTYSSVTLTTQKHFLIAVSIQSACIVITVLIPILALAWSIFIWYHNQKLNNILCSIISAHGTISTIVMVLVHKPYREFAFSFLYSKPKIGNVENRRSVHTAATC